MSIREADIADIPAMHRIRLTVKENVLRNPLAVQGADYEPYLSLPNSGWVCESANQIVGFSIVNVAGNELWALFIDPAFEGKGIGGGLHDILVNGFFTQSSVELMFGTEAGTRAEKFYTQKGWAASGQKTNGEIIFKMQRKDLFLST
ncbi:MAG: hypothetical protein RL567_1859 [Bacteroidota bacterium]|jgi:GNAT superfamily N-acetyltransferase